MVTDERTVEAPTDGSGRRAWAAATAPIGPLPAAVVVAAVGAGVILRIALMRSPAGALDSDEAVVGLMARQMAAGHFRAFFWGQPYGGTLEAALAAAAFKVFGPTTVALKGVPVLLSGVSGWLAWRVGRRVLPPGPAAVAALVVWLWPANYLWWSVKARGFYEATLCLGLGACLAALRIGQEEGSRWGDWALLGLCGGLGWWQSPQIAYVLVPVAAWLIWTRRWGAWRALVTLPGLAAGSLPWWWANLQDGFASLQAPPAPVKGGYLSHLAVLGREGLPMTLGLKVIYSSRWVRPEVLTAVLYGAAAIAIAAGCLRRWPRGGLVVVLVVAFPFLHALLPLAGTVAEGRYTLLALPLVALVLARVANRRVGAGALTVACVAVTVLGLRALTGQTTPFFSGRHIPASLASLETGLERHGTTRVWTGYWVAYRLTFETRERVIAAPIVDDRYAPIAETVAFAAIPAAHVYLSGTRDDLAFRSGLQARHIRFSSYAVGSEWTVYLPDRPVDATAIPHSYP